MAVKQMTSPSWRCKCCHYWVEQVSWPGRDAFSRYCDDERRFTSLVFGPNKAAPRSTCRNEPARVGDRNARTEGKDGAPRSQDTRLRLRKWPPFSPTICSPGSTPPSS